MKSSGVTIIGQTRNYGFDRFDNNNSTIRGSMNNTTTPFSQRQSHKKRVFKLNTELETITDGLSQSKETLVLNTNTQIGFNRIPQPKKISFHTYQLEVENPVYVDSEMLSALKTKELNLRKTIT